MRNLSHWLLPLYLFFATASRAQPLQDFALEQVALPIFYKASVEKVEKRLELYRAELLLTADESKKIYELSSKIFVVSNLLAFQRDELARITLPATRAATETFYASDLGKNIVAAMLQVRSPDYEARKQKFFQTYAAAKVKPNRLNVFRSLLRALRIADITAEIEFTGAYAGEIARNGLKAGNARERREASYSRLEPIRNAAAADLPQEATNHFLFLLREFTNKQIDNYIRFLTTTEGIHFVEAIVSSSKATLESAAKTLADRVERGTRGGVQPDL